MTETLTIDRRYQGYDGVGHGGYIAGVLARGMATAEVVFRAPSPLGKPLDCVTEGEVVGLHDGTTVLAEARPAKLDIEPPPPPDWPAVEAAAGRCPLHGRHPWPACFVCGTDRAEGDGLRLTPGPVAGNGLMAAPWAPHGSLAGAGGAVAPEYVWAALDCPGWYALCGWPPRPLLTVRMTARLDRPVAAGARHVVLSWPISRGRRREISGAAVFTEAGALCAIARASWFVPPAEA